jgi:hypothetical protein
MLKVLTGTARTMVSEAFPLLPFVKSTSTHRQFSGFDNLQVQSTESMSICGERVSVYRKRSARERSLIKDINKLSREISELIIKDADLDKLDTMVEHELQEQKKAFEKRRKEKVGKKKKIVKAVLELQAEEPSTETGCCI